MHPDNQTPINHIKPPKPKPPNPSTAHYPNQSPRKKTITIYTPELVTLAVALGMWNLKIQVSKFDPPTELRLYVGASIPKDKTKDGQTPLQI